MKDPKKKEEEEQQQPEIPDWMKAVYIPTCQSISLDMLSNAVSKKTGLSLEKVKEAISDFEKVTYMLIKQGQTINLKGLGKFYPVPKEGDIYDPNDEFEVRFEPSEALLKRLKERITTNPSMN